MPLFFWPQFSEICAGTSLRREGNFGAGKFIDEAGKTAARENRRRLLAELGVSRLSTFRQTHSSTVLPACGDSLDEADALITNRPGELLGVHTADCIPVFFYSPQHRAIGLAHSGRKGLLAGISENVLKALETNYGAKPRDVYIHIGPHISASVYEVGADIFAEFGLPCLGAKGMLDMQSILIERLTGVGVLQRNISTSNMCTLSSKDAEGQPLFFSYRGGDKGQIFSFLGLHS